MKIKRLSCFFICILLLFMNLFALFPTAAGKINPMNTTNVLDDLIANDFMISNYPKDESATFVSMIHFLEFGYSAKGKHDLYNLYVYIYNPSGKPINPIGNTIQLSYTDGIGNKAVYKKYPLKVVGISEDTQSGDYDNLFYKFMIDGVVSISSKVNPNKRSYHFSGIELKYSGESKVKDYEVKQTWNYTGYQENFDKTGKGKSTLYATVDVEEVIKTELHAASWFSKTCNLGEDYRNEVSSVYFNIADYFIKTYGDPNSATSGLYAVRGVYDKYVTNGLLIDDRQLYDQFIGSGDYLPSISVSPGYDSKKHTTGNLGFAQFKSEYVNGIVYMLQYNFAYNMMHYTDLSVPQRPKNITTDKQLTKLFYPMYSSDLTLSQDEFLQKYQESRQYYTSSDLMFLKNDSTVFKNLGSSKKYEIKVDQGSWNDVIRSYASTHGEWYWRFYNFLTGKNDLYADEEGYSSIDPIVEIKSISSSNAVAGKELFIMNDQVDDLRSFYNAKKSKNHVYLMRFDVNPYYGPECVLKDGDSTVLSGDDYNSIYFEKVVFQNFDVLEFVFRNQYGLPMTIPVVCDPIDVVGGVVPGGNDVDNDPNKPGIQDGGLDELDPADRDWSWVWKLLIGVGFFCIILLILNFLGVPVRPIVQALFFVLSIPFRILIWIPKAIGKLFGAGKELSEEKRKKEVHSWLRNEEKRKQEQHEADLFTKASEQIRKDEKQTWDREDRYERK